MTNYLLLAKRAGFIASLLFPLIILLTGALTPNYSHSSQYISELGAVGAPFHYLMNWLGIAPFGLLICFFSCSISFYLRPGIIAWIAGFFLLLSGLGFLIAGLFSCDVGCSFATMSQSQVIHNLSSMGGFIAAILASGILSLRLITMRNQKDLIYPLYLTSLIMCLLMVLSLTSMYFVGPNSSIIGLLQRCFIASLCIWLGLSSRYLLKCVNQ